MRNAGRYRVIERFLARTYTHCPLQTHRLELHLRPDIQLNHREQESFHQSMQTEFCRKWRNSKTSDESPPTRPPINTKALYDDNKIHNLSVHIKSRFRRIVDDTSQRRSRPAIVAYLTAKIFTQPHARRPSTPHAERQQARRHEAKTRDQQ